MITGVLLGLGAAALQAISYLFSEVFIRKHNTGASSYFVLVHVAMGVLSALLLPFLWHPLALNIDQYGPALVSAAAAYLFGQYSLYQAIHHSTAARVSPLLGLKIFVLALIGSIVFEEQYRLLHWAAVSLCILGAVWLSASGGKIAGRALAWIIAACLGYAASDIAIVQLIQHFDALPKLSAALLSVTLCYLLCGLSCLIFITKIKHAHLLVASAPAAISWFLAMACLFACFAEIGVVFGGIVQSSRGLISILLALLLVQLSVHIATPLPPKSVIIQRISATSLMTIAIVLFSIADS